MYYHHGIVDSIGRTPLVRLNRILGTTIALKREFKEPLGSIMDRIGRVMIEATGLSFQP